MSNLIKSILNVLTCSARKKGWKVGHCNRDSLFYDELREGKWERVIIDGEMQFSNQNPLHIIWFPTIEEWNKLPKWTEGRRNEILYRMQEELKPPRYKYE